MVLLDTRTLLWLASNPSALPVQVKQRITAASGNALFVSAVSVLEVGTKVARGKLVLPSKPRLWFHRTCQERGILSIPINWSIAARATELPWHHRDPADRIIISTAIEHRLTLLTPDAHIARYDEVSTLWK